MSIYKPKSGIAFDIDGIILDTGTEIWKVVMLHLNLPWSIDSWKDYYIENVVGHPLESLVEVYEQVLQRDDIPLLPGAEWVLRRFYETTKEPISLITARRPKFLESAIRSIKRVLPNIPFDVVGTSRSNDRLGDNKVGHNKIDFLKQKNIELFIDDYPFSWEDYIQSGISIATLEWPWTREHAQFLYRKYPEAFEMVSDWIELEFLLRYFLEKKDESWEVMP